MSAARERFSAVYQEQVIDVDKKKHRKNIETTGMTTHIKFTTTTMIAVCFKPRLKKAGAAEPVLNASMLKFAENQTKNIW